MHAGPRGHLAQVTMRLPSLSSLGPLGSTAMQRQPHPPMLASSLPGTIPGASLCGTPCLRRSLLRPTVPCQGWGRTGTQGMVIQTIMSLRPSTSPRHLLRSASSLLPHTPPPLPHPLLHLWGPTYSRADPSGLDIDWWLAFDRSAIASPYCPIHVMLPRDKRRLCERACGSSTSITAAT